MARYYRAAVAFSAACALLLTATGCGEDDPKNTSGSDGGSREFVLIAAASDNAFFKPMECGAKSAIDPQGGSLQVNAPNTPGDIPGMVQILNAAIAKEPDAIIIDPVDPEAFTAGLKKARESGIKVILLDNALADKEAYDTAVTADNLLAGQQAGAEMVEALGGTGKVLTLGGIPGQATLEARVDGFRDEIAKSAGISDVGVQYSQQDNTKAAGIVAAQLAKDPDLAGVWATSYNEMVGALSAIRRADKLDQVTIISFDTTEDQVQMVRDGEVHALVGQSPEVMGSQGVESAYTLFDGGSVEQDQPADTLLITKDNVDDPATEKYFYRTDC